MDDKRIQELIQEAVNKVLGEQEGNIPTPSSNPTQTPQPTPEPQKKATVVNFDKDTDQPFSVKFTERGFVVDDTRLSFETLENALSKNYDIVLRQGQGLHLNQVRMQKIMKYKDLY